MCGIAGIIGLNSASTNVKNMLEAMHHRGPDDWGIFEEENATLGQKRLSIIDLSSAGHQPMTSLCGKFTIVFNGEIYNYKELRSLLPNNIQLKSNTDTEVVLELWSKIGKDVLPKLRGMFAFAVRNNETQSITLVRDHMGIKPLYYGNISGCLLFSSEIKGIIAANITPIEIDREAVAQYLNIGYIQQPKSILKNFYMLEPGSYLIWEQGKITKTFFWDITLEKEDTFNSEQEAISKTRELIINSVKEELISDRAIGLFLSGGLDSSVLLACLNEIGIKNINSYSVCFEGDNSTDVNDADITAKYYNINHSTIKIMDNEIHSLLEKHIRAIDQPSIDGFNTFIVSNAASNEVTVALSGLGGDELFSGYRIDRDILYNSKFLPIYKFIAVTENIWKKILPSKINKKLSAYSLRSNLKSYYNQWGQVFSEEEVNKFLNTSYKSNIASIDIGPKYDTLQRISYLHLRTFMLSRLLRDGDTTSMYSSIEVRFPLIDKRIVEYVFNLPLHWKIKNPYKKLNHIKYEQTSSYKADGIKHLLYSSFESLLPPDFGTRPKRGFHFPIKRWIDTILKDDISETLQKSKYLSNEFVQDVLKQYYIDKKINYTKVWSLYLLEKWIKQNIK